MRRVVLSTLILLMLSITVGCARPPIRVNIEKLIASPAIFKNQYVEIAGYVKRNEVRGDRYVTWSLVLEHDGHTIRCIENGYNPEVVAQAYELAREAMEAGEQLRVRGRFRVDHGEMEKGAILEVDTVEYKGMIIKTDHNDYRYMPWRWWYYGVGVSYWD